MRNTAKKTHRLLSVLLGILGILLIVLSLAAYYAAKWYADIYGQMGFDSILYTLTAGINGTDPGLIQSFLSTVLPKILSWSIPVCFLLYFRARKKVVLILFRKLRIRLFPLSRLACAVITVAMCCGLLSSAAKISELDKYIVNLRELSHIYEEEYRDPKTTKITFPEQKRNLIYIYLESMETSYLSKEQGGMLDYNIIPELYTLAQENTNFSHNEDVGGFSVASGASWTIGAMVGHTAGIPLKTPPGVDGNSYGADGNFLPGVTNLTDILHENGYYQALMVGSNASFGGRREYYTSHGVDRVYDLYTARADGLIPADYYVWWGFEDHYLFSYAQQALSEMSQQEQPFAFTMLTVDTHHIGGYACQFCENTHEEQYENVMECSSKQVAAFVQWLQQQPFYENTTVIIAGDHASMDNGYFSRVSPEGYDRHVYNCFINSAVSTENTHNRNFCAYDLFPTTLAAMGCAIEGDRLGLGTNLFSVTPTLLEATNGAIAEEFEKSSTYYTNNFFFK